MFIVNQSEIVTISAPEEFESSLGEIQVTTQYTTTFRDGTERPNKSISIITRDARTLELFKTDRTDNIIRHTIHNASITNKDTKLHNVVVSLSSNTISPIELINTSLDAGNKYIFTGKEFQIYDDTGLEISSGSIPGVKFRQFKVISENTKFTDSDDSTQFVFTGNRDVVEHVLPPASDVELGWAISISNLSISGEEFTVFPIGTDTINGEFSLVVVYGELVNIIKTGDTTFTSVSSFGAMASAGSNKIIVNELEDFPTPVSEVKDHQKIPKAHLWV